MIVIFSGVWFAVLWPVFSHIFSFILYTSNDKSCPWKKDLKGSFTKQLAIGNIKTKIKQTC